MKCFEVVTSVEGQVVRFDVRAGEAGGIVTIVACFDMEFLERLCEIFNICLLEGNVVVDTCEKQRAVLSGVHTGVWKGCLSITDMKTIVHAVGECAVLLAVRKASPVD